jgi:hypothetical protein
LNADGGEFGMIGVAVSAEVFGFFARVDVDFPSQSMLKGIEAGAALAGGRAGSGLCLRGGELLICHVW